MVKFRDASPGAAYQIADGVTDAAEADKLGLVVVECTAFGLPSAYGRYKVSDEAVVIDAETDAPTSPAGR